MLILSEEEVAATVDMEEAISAVEKAFLELEEGSAQQPPRTVMEISEYKGSILFMPSYLREGSVVSAKIVSIYGENVKRGLPTLHSAIILCDPETGEIRCLMNGNYVTAIRTGAGSGVATKYLARKDSEVCGIIGAGAQAWTQLWAVLTVSKVNHVKVYDIVREKAVEFAKRAMERFEITAEATDSAEEASRNVDILVTATTSRVPVLRGEWLAPGTHINSIGWMGAGSRELDSETVARAKVVVDNREAVLSEICDFTTPIAEGKITENHIYAELGEIIAGKKLGRTGEEEITLWKSVGQSIQDAAVAKIVYLKALKKGLGTHIEL